MQVPPQFGSRPPTPSKRGRSLARESGSASRDSSMSTMSGYSDSRGSSHSRERSPSVDRAIRHEARRVMKDFGATVQAVVDRVNTKRPDKPKIDHSYADLVLDRQAETLSKLTGVSKFQLPTHPRSQGFYESVRSASLASGKRRRETEESMTDAQQYTGQQIEYIKPKGDLPSDPAKIPHFDKIPINFMFVDFEPPEYAGLSPVNPEISHSDLIRKIPHNKNDILRVSNDGKYVSRINKETNDIIVYDASTNRNCSM